MGKVMVKSYAKKAKDMSKRIRALEDKLCKKYNIKRVRYGRDSKKDKGIL